MCTPAAVRLSPPSSFFVVVKLPLLRSRVAYQGRDWTACDGGCCKASDTGKVEGLCSVKKDMFRSQTVMLLPLRTLPYLLYLPVLNYIDHQNYNRPRCGFTISHSCDVNITN